MKYSRIPDETVRRMPIYLRGLQLFTEQGYKRVSSKKLAEALYIKSAQLRKDLSYFGDFGIPGVGYDPIRLSEQIRSIMNLNIAHPMVLVGCGNLGLALAKYIEAQNTGLKVAALFDNDRKKIGRLVQNCRIEDIKRLSTLKKRKVFLALLAVPYQAAQEVTDQLTRAGVLGILNFVPCRLNVPRFVKVINIDIGLDLARLPYYLPKSIRLSG